MKIPITKPFFDKEEETAVAEVLRSGWIMQGPKVSEFEKEIASYVGSQFAVAVTSGTAALHLSLMALGIGEGDEVIVPSFSFIATANCVLYVGAKPIFADIDPKTFNIDPKDVEKKITKKTKAIIAVHQIGLTAEVDKLLKICKEHNLLLVEDAACALGSEFDGKKAGVFGDVGCFSFHPRKSITTGEGGIITTSNEELYKKLQSLKNHGVVKKNGEEIYPILGYNYRMTDIQAAIGIAQLKKLESLLDERIKRAHIYDSAFSKNNYIEVPSVPSRMKHTYQSYMIKINSSGSSRDKIAEELEKKGISVKKGIMLIHKQPLYKDMFGQIKLPVSENVSQHSLILPLFSQMTQEEQDFVISKVNNNSKLNKH